MKILLKALSYARNLWPYYLGITISTFFVALTSLAIPFIIKAATDLMVHAVQSGTADVRGAVLLAALLFLFDVANTFVRNIGGYWGDMMASKLKMQLSTRYYKHLLSLSQSYYDNELTGTIINRLNRAITEVTNFLNVFANNFFQMLITTIITLIIVGFYSWQLALMVLLIYPVFLWLTALTSKKWQKLQHEKNTETDIASGRFAEVVSQIRVVKSYIKEKYEFSHFQRRFNKTVSITRGQSSYWHKMDVARGLVLSTIFFGIYVLIFTETVQQHFTIGEMVLLITLINGVRMPIFSMSFLVDQFQRAITGSRDFVTAMEIEPAIKDISGADKLEITNARVEYQDITFSYNADEPVLRSINFSIAPGEKIALVGESGEGKTTLSNLLMRLYQPGNGKIMIDNIDIANVTQESLRSNIATVFQDPNLFSGTIHENIAYARPDASNEDIILAAKSANAHGFIDKLEKGYESEIGERGIKLSGGQKQRIAIARAILKNAPILILDEATSSLDSRAEHQVQEALDRLMHGRTTLIIAHRLSTIAHVDKIVTLKGGQIDEVGAPHELAKTGGIYSQLLDLQMGTTEKAKKKLEGFEIHG